MSTTKRRIALLLELPADNPDMIGMIALRRLLKGLLRAYGLRCIDISEQPDEPSEGPSFIAGDERTRLHRFLDRE